MLNRFNQFPESLKNSIGLIGLTIIIFFTFFVLNIFYGPSVSIIESINPAKTGFLGGLGLPIIVSWLVAAFVARVVDRLTREISSRFPFHDVSRASIALSTPIARLWRVVSDLADAITRRSDISSKAASVKVPPVSSPTTSVMSLLLLPHSGP